MQESINKKPQVLNFYEIKLLNGLKVDLDGEIYEGLELIGKIVVDNAIGNYRVYNMVTDGIGQHHEVGKLLTKLGVQ